MKKHRTNSIEIRNVDLAATLYTLHFKLRPEQPITLMLHDGGKRTVTFHFLEEAEHDRFGPLTASAVFQIFEGNEEKRAQASEELVELIDHLREKDKTRNALLDIIRPKSDGGQGLVTPLVETHIEGVGQVIMPQNASDELKAKVQRMIEKVA